MKPVPVVPGPQQESVWDYPRPPRLERTGAVIEIVCGATRVARTDQAHRVLETSHPPTYYLPRGAFADGGLVPTSGSSVCEWKGRAAYADLVVPTEDGEIRLPRAAWTYPDPSPDFRDLVDHWAVMPGAPLTCTVDGETVVPQEGGFYGGWITSAVAGPFKGIPGSWGW